MSEVQLSNFRETDKLLLGVIYPIIFLEYPLFFKPGVRKSKRSNAYPIKIVGLV